MFTVQVGTLVQDSREVRRMARGLHTLILQFVQFHLDRHIDLQGMVDDYVPNGLC